VSRLYRIGYNSLAVLALVMILPPLPSLTPFELICPARQAFKAFSFIRIQFLRCFLFSSFIIEQKTLLVNLTT
jgi:hypothetical protein